MIPKYSLFYDKFAYNYPYIIKEFAIVGEETKSRFVESFSTLEEGIKGLSGYGDGPILLATSWEPMDNSFDT